MAAIADIVIADGEATPVNHTFKPIYVRNEDGAQVAFYRESMTGVPVDAQPTLKLTQKKLPKGGVYRLSARVEVPVMESVSGQNSAGYTAAPKVAYTVTAEAVIYSPERSTAQQRKNDRALLWNLLANSACISLLDDVISPT